MILINESKIATALNKYRKYLIATAILLMVVVGIAAFPSQSSGPRIEIIGTEDVSPLESFNMQGHGFTPGATLNISGESSVVS